MTDQQDQETFAPDEVPNLPDKATDVAGELQAFAEYAKGLPTDDPEEVQSRILEAMMRATTPEDILRAGEAMPAEQVVDLPLTILGIRGSESAFEEGSDLYLHVDARLISNGDHVTFSCGARDVVVKLIRLDQLHMLPVDAKIIRAKKPTKAGYFPLFIRVLEPDERPFA